LRFLLGTRLNDSVALIKVLGDWQATQLPK
jgi:hypothetical protein